VGSRYLPCLVLWAHACEASHAETRALHDGKFHCPRLRLGGVAVLEADAAHTGPAGNPHR
jgi:hypothetical protein